MAGTMTTEKVGRATRKAAASAATEGQSIPIAEYGMLADCNSAAHVSRAGSVDWLCLPRYDSPAIFARLLGPDAGHWSIRPAGEFYSEHRYLPGTLVLETTFTTDDGTVKVTDAMSFAEGQRGHDLGLRSPHELVRLVEGVSGTVELELELAPRPEYGLVRPLFRRTPDGGKTFGGPTRVAVTAGVPVEISEATMRASFTVVANQQVGFAMRWTAVEDEAPTPTPASRVAERIEDTVEGWRSWEREHDIYEGPHHELVHFSSRVLKGLTYRPTGAIVAAATTSLPEDTGGERNWDYRFAWIRDASLTLQALYIGSCSDEAGHFISFMTSAAGGRVKGGSLQIMYGVGGEHDLTERELDHLPGWRDSRPVRVGNGAWGQTQLDVYGELLDALWLYQERLGELHPEIQEFVADLADAAADGWRQRDAGMWEMRGDPQHHLSSKVLCWTALDRAVKLGAMLGEHGAKVDGWAAERDRIRDAVLERGWSEERQAYAQAFDSDELDAAALLMPLVGFLPATDERMRSTIDAIARDLAEDGLVLRYRNQDGLNADGLEGEEGTFVICSFWLVSCLARAGEIDEAEALFDRLAGYANDLGLLAEEIDTANDELLGNFPQAFSHIGLITAAWEIDKARGAAADSLPG
jgi:GH15 family glucan-1,4-alpha-glucosidase